MSEQEYMEARVDNQIAWYNKKSSINKSYDLKSKALIMIFFALILFAAGYNDPSEPWIDYIIALLGVLIAVFTGFRHSINFRTNGVLTE
jgi:hypothetical protein